MICSRHGGLRHARVHETAHALAALERGIPFVDVVVYPRGASLPNGSEIGGRVKLDEDRGWRTSDPRQLFEFVIAGSLGEEAVLGHHLQGGWDEDITIWRQTVGLFKGGQPKELERVLGQSPQIVIDRMRTWAIERVTLVEYVERQLMVSETFTEEELDRIVRSFASRSPEGVPPHHVEDGSTWGHSAGRSS